MVPDVANHTCQYNLCSPRSANRNSTALRHDLAQGTLLHPDNGVVIRHASGGFGDAAADNDVAFGPMDLQVASGDGREKNAAFEAASFIREDDGVVVN